MKYVGKMTRIILLSVVALIGVSSVGAPTQAYAADLSSVTISFDKVTLNGHLTADVTPSGETVSYQWLRNGQAIAKATKATYTVVAADMCNQVSVRVTSSNTVTSTSVIPRFADVPTSNTFYSAICWAVQNGLTAGTGDGSTYSPGNPVNRGAMSAFIMRELGSPAFTPPTVSPFEDLPTTHTFYKSVTWLAARGITGGVQVGDQLLYYPANPVNRGSMAQFLYRAAGSPQYSPPATSPFVDVPTTHTFYKAINWLHEEGITVGVEVGGQLLYFPDNTVSRGSMAAFLRRFQAQLPPPGSGADPGAPATPGPCDNQPATGAGQYQSFCEAVSGAKSYIWEVSTTSDMSNVVSQFVANKASTTLTPLVEYATYYQTVRACGSKDGVAPCSARSAVQTVTLAGKEWGTVHNFRIDSVTDTQVTVSWDHAAGVTRYDLVVTDRVGGSVLRTETVAASSSCPTKGTEDTPTTFTFDWANYQNLVPSGLFFVNVRGYRCASAAFHDSSPTFPTEFGFPQPSGPSFTATALTFNILKQSSADHHYDNRPLHGDLSILHSWDNRLPFLAAHAEDADIVGVQEMGWWPGGTSQHYPLEFAQATGLTLAMEPNSPSTPCSIYAEHIFYNAAKFTLISCGVSSLTSENDRFMSWAVLRDIASQVSVFVANTHTTLPVPEVSAAIDQPASPEALAVAQALVDAINQANVNGLPVLLLGDFNSAEAQPGDNPLTVLADAGYLNTRWIAQSRDYPNAYLPSRHAFNPVVQGKYSVSVDHVLTSPGIDVNNFAVRYVDPDTAYTDHFGVEATITVY
ncbi:MAG: S-layer homology domain-containing protein [Propionibacteriaceae bacterium]|jgi:endonuclease/exonuclease/phosphatase family metal-dependent hydrolase|nr:S-layer homology domain-containing protein [Propionibacteriaceae bacterium]